MNKLTVIQLLNKIANGEEIPDLFFFAGDTFTKETDGSYVDRDGDVLFDSLFRDFSNLNDEIEIIGEDTSKKIEKIDKLNDSYLIDLVNYKNGSAKALSNLLMEFHKLENKLNEIIDYINKGDSNDR